MSFNLFLNYIFISKYASLICPAGPSHYVFEFRTYDCAAVHGAEQINADDDDGIAMRYRKVSIPDLGIVIRNRKVSIPGKGIERGY